MAGDKSNLAKPTQISNTRAQANLPNKRKRGDDPGEGSSGRSASLKITAPPKQPATPITDPNLVAALRQKLADLTVQPQSGTVASGDWRELPFFNSEIWQMALENPAFETLAGDIVTAGRIAGDEFSQAVKDLAAAMVASWTETSRRRLFIVLLLPFKISLAFLWILFETERHGF